MVKRRSGTSVLSELAWRTNRVRVEAARRTAIAHGSARRSRPSVTLSGSGDVRVAGQAEFASVWLSGSGDLKLRELEVREADVQISGSGDVEITVSERLDVRVSGAKHMPFANCARATHNHARRGRDARNVAAPSW